MEDVLKLASLYFGFGRQGVYDAFQSETAPTDRKLIVDIAVLCEVLENDNDNGFVSWVWGKETLCNGFFKWYGNGTLEHILYYGKGYFMVIENAAKSRHRVAEWKC